MFQLKELKERQKQQLRHKALKKGLDPEALTGKYPVSNSAAAVSACLRSIGNQPALVLCGVPTFPHQGLLTNTSDYSLF